MHILKNHYRKKSAKKGKGKMKKFVCGVFVAGVMLSGCASPEEKPGEGGVSFGGGYKDAFLEKPTPAVAHHIKQAMCWDILPCYR